MVAFELGEEGQLICTLSQKSVRAKRVLAEVPPELIVRALRTFVLSVRILRTIMALDADDNEEQWMRVISKARLRAFWQEPEHGDAEGPLRAWHTHVSSKTVSWQLWGDVRTDFATASLVGNCVVFNIGGNKYRLVTRILYPSQKVFILKVMTHSEYDQDKWKKECGCFEPPPKPKKAKKLKRRSHKTKRKGH